MTAQRNPAAVLQARLFLLHCNIQDACDLADSLVSSVKEAAWRGWTVGVSVHSDQLRKVVVELMRLKREAATLDANLKTMEGGNG